MLCSVAGETYLILDRPLAAVVQHLHKRVEQNTQLRWPVSKIEHSSAGAKIYGPSGENASSANLMSPRAKLSYKLNDFLGYFETPQLLTSHAALCACRQCSGVSPCNSHSSNSDAAAGEDTVFSSPAG